MLNTVDTDQSEPNSHKNSIGKSMNDQRLFHCKFHYIQLRFTWRCIARSTKKKKLSFYSWDKNVGGQKKKEQYSSINRLGNCTTGTEYIEKPKRKKTFCIRFLIINKFNFVDIKSIATHVS